MSIGFIYFLSFAVGLGYAIFVGVAGHLFGGDTGDAHMDVGTDLPLSPLSPTVIATFLTGFGAKFDFISPKMRTPKPGPGKG